MANCSSEIMEAALTADIRPYEMFSSVTSENVVRLYLACLTISNELARTLQLSGYSMRRHDIEKAKHWLSKIEAMGTKRLMAHEMLGAAIDELEHPEATTAKLLRTAETKHLATFNELIEQQIAMLKGVIANSTVCCN